MQLLEDMNKVRRGSVDRSDAAFDEKIGVFGKLFGCWHKELSRPFSDNRGSYRVCVDCGARKKFDTRTFRTFGTYYYPQSLG